jgi:hypothetical protein
MTILKVITGVVILVDLVSLTLMWLINIREIRKTRESIKNKKFTIAYKPIDTNIEEEIEVL